MRLLRTLHVAYAAAFVLCLGTFPAMGEKRVALVIGNGLYEHADRLSNPLTDSRNVRDTLKKIGFPETNIIYGENLNKRDLERSIGRFALLAHDADVAITYYAGHGSTFGDAPYLVPTDARFESVDQMPYELVPLETMISELRHARGVRIAIVDACRDNSAEHELKRIESRGGEIVRGLAPPRNPEGLIVAYATQYLSTAADGPAGSDSPFTAALLKYLPKPGLDIRDLFFEVGREVLAATKGRQRPEVKVSFYEKYALVPENAHPAVTEDSGGAHESVQASLADPDADRRAVERLAEENRRKRQDQVTKERAELQRLLIARRTAVGRKAEQLDAAIRELDRREVERLAAEHREQRMRESTRP